ncbi:polyprenyl synthetase family protein [Sulfitobacter aestuarii]|uniref:Polyprenyl synthetase family protein n=1 Tax=Sulfitobacter aestuarii TaxID=2161676 RepID=A0ABW5TXF0_9RHOB
MVTANRSARGRLKDCELRVTADLKPRSFATALHHAQEVAANGIAQALTGAEGPVAAAMLYATRGGKGLRAFLALESARLHGFDAAAAAPAAAAIEAMHGYSLIHDDLPCMDDDDLRRGQPSVHRRWDETTAVLSGDALQALAFQLIAQVGCPPQQQVSLVLSLAQAAGVRGMVGGQALDIAAESAAEPLTLAEITGLQSGKTGALIEWAASVGPRMAGADITALSRYAADLGLAFQIADDILDVEGDAAEMGKAVGKDDAAGKATFVSLLGLEAARRRAGELAESACDALSPYGEDAATLRDAARFVIARQN